MVEEKKDIFNKYIEIHNSGTPLKKVHSIDDQTFWTLLGSNVDVRIIDRDKHLSIIPSLKALGTFSKDTVEYSHRFFYSIPLQTVSGTIVGFIYRTVFGKAYVTVTRDFSDKDHKIPIMFGFYKDFEDFDKSESCPPIIVCEGLKDCITLKKIYPYVVSNNTSHMGLNLQVLGNLTNKFILLYDNDEAGKNGTLNDITNLQKMKYSVIEMKISNGFKDVTDLSEDTEKFSKLSNLIKNNIYKLEHQDENYLALCRTRIKTNR